jgi:hypothetical protein
MIGPRQRAAVCRGGYLRELEMSLGQMIGGDLPGRNCKCRLKA